MSKSANMLRTRRKDNNVKPNRRLDRKSSRGMLYENEELRLKTININAEVERGQSDIKKLKRENDQLRREIWYLRDEYDKLDKLLREKECQGSSSTSCTSESESCSSCTEESEAVETSQNIENFQKTNLKKATQEFDHLSVVPEENSTENSEKTSNSNQVQSADNWNSTTLEKDVIKPDQSYPIHKSSTLPIQEKMPKHFFSPIKTNKINDDYVNNEFLGPEMPYMGQIYSQPIHNGAGFVPHSNYYPGLTLPPLNKTTTDVIVKTDNQNFNTLKSQSSFSNGGNLEELLNDIETISHDILNMTNPQQQYSLSGPSQNFCSPFASFPTESFPENKSNTIPQLHSYPSAGQIDNYAPTNRSPTDERIPPDRPYKSELNVVLMPSPMQLIGVEKYKNIQKSCESLNARSIENLSTSCQNLKIIPEATPPNVIISPDTFYGSTSQQDIFQPFVPVPPLCPSPKILPESSQQQNLFNEQTNPFFFGGVRHQAESSEYFTARYVPETSAVKDEDKNKWRVESTKQRKDNEMYSSKTNLIDTAHSSDHVSSENEENLKFKTSRDKTADSKVKDKIPESKKNEDTKSPKMGIRGKVSIHFKGKKDKSNKTKEAKNLEKPKQDEKPKSPIQDKKHSFFDIKFSSDSKDKKVLRKTPSIESKISNVAIEPKTTTSGESKTSTSDNKNYKTDSKNFESSSNSISDQKPRSHYDGKMPDSKALDRKNRKSSSASPERKHGHKEGKKCNRKNKKGERNKIRRSSFSADRFHRERSYSICTDRSNILDHRLGLYMYDDFTTSDRERTNSLSSCDTIKGRKLSNVSHFPATGKIPWCACWGNGCL
ncbi:hypothetical protein ILUMI_25707 [Ignelater luminosus]|uniref:Uncharacterized protein n=1 Tax=Ignelater luminosus TaxID=2038154 RepID=A0A8K0C6Y1_IGNLU|nr:hypothetical protein ILUMI_25707 [Ignelater luminosus]